MSLARKHKQKTIATAAAIAVAVTSDSMEGANPYELMLAQLGRDKNQLSKIDSHVTRNEKKLELLPTYAAYVDGILVSDAGVQDDVLVTIMLWHIDCLNFDVALDIAEYAIKHKLQMPADFKRNLVTTVTEQIAEEAMAHADFDALPALQRLEDATAEQDMLDEVRAKLCRALGERLEETDPKKALAQFEKALALNKDSGVKTKVKSLTKKLEAAE
jgi:tetratricopeptide (TPR) repeat protein